MKRILLFAGSTSAQSINRKIVEQAAGMLNGHKATLIDLRDFPLPLFSVDLEEQEGIPESARKLRELLQGHDALVVSVAEHNATITTAFKNTMDWLSRTQEDYRILLGKQVWLLSTSPAESGGAGALEDARAIFSILGAEVAGAVAIGSFYHISKEDIRQHVGQALKNF
ncbi:NAD(P)H-dependent oxidoreductase [Parapedobacter deserti]|uniref:NAD(P)H-dependent oxidoreductase n=1 Tax=Parapedobacter deserti TaxID=1912957 RepID=A0ABV7JHC5_9SPHI